MGNRITIYSLEQLCELLEIPQEVAINDKEKFIQALNRAIEKNLVSMLDAVSLSCSVCGRALFIRMTGAYRKGIISTCWTCERQTKRPKPKNERRRILRSWQAPCGEVIVPANRIVCQDGPYGYMRPRKCVLLCDDAMYNECLVLAASMRWPGWDFAKPKKHEVTTQTAKESIGHAL